MTEPLSAGVFATVGQIDLKIDGDPAALYELAKSMERVGRKLEGVEGRLGILPLNVGTFWQGEAFEAFDRMAALHASAIKELATFARDSASVVDAYGGLVERGRDYFADYAYAATQAGLVVSQERFIYPPTSPNTTCSVDGSDNETKYTYLYLVELFLEIEKLVAEWRADAKQWIATHFLPLIGHCGSETGVDALVTNLLGIGLDWVTEVIDAAEARTSKHLETYLDTQRAYDERWAEHKGDGRSGDPGRNGRAELYDEDAHRAGRGDIDAKIAKLKPADFLLKSGKLLGPAGTVALAGYELYQGESPSKVGAGVAGGAAGGALTGAATGALVGIWAGPLGAGIGAAIGAVAGGWAGGKGAEWGWEEWVPLRSRQAIDEGLTGAYRISSGLDPIGRAQIPVPKGFP